MAALSNFIPTAISILMLWAGIVSTNHTEYLQLIEDAKSIASAAHLRNQHYETLIHKVCPPSSTTDHNSQPMFLNQLDSTPSFYYSLSEVLKTKANEYVLLYKTSDDTQKQEALEKLQDLRDALEHSLQSSDWNLTEEEVSQNIIELQQPNAFTSIAEDQMIQEINDTIAYINNLILTINPIT